MTIDELVEKLNKVKDELGHDPEQSHWEADKLLLAYINNEDATQAYNTVPGWYA
jgi:hypothetical protein